MLYFLIIIVSMILLFFYKRYVPVKGVHCVRSLIKDNNTIKIIDVRDYNDSYKQPIPGSINIPVAYLKRYYPSVANNEIIIVASSTLEKNMSIRFLRKKGCQIVGYTLTNCNSKLGIDEKIA